MPNRRSCARCAWRPQDNETLEQHAEASEHPLCTACGRSLPGDRPRVCRDCQDRAGERLAAILDLWLELPDLLELHASERLPGGDVLLLLGGGSAGNRSRYGEDYEPDPARSPERWWPLGAIGPLTLAQYLAVERARWGKEHLADNLTTEPSPVAWTLHAWANDWRRLRDEHPPDHDDDVTAGHPQQVRTDHAYLTEHHAWAARKHWAWAEYAADLAHLHGTLLRATGRHREPRRLGVDCFGCGGQLRYLVDDNGLEQAHATCRDCSTTYTVEQLLLAQRAAVEDAQWFQDDTGDTWGTVKAVADYVHRSHWSLRSWRRDGLVRSVQHGGVVYLHLYDVEQQAGLREQRATRRTATSC
jgi:hypothetical protein